MLTIPQIETVVRRARKRVKSRTWPKFYLTMEQVDAYLEKCYAEKEAVKSKKRIAVIGKICGRCEKDLPFTEFYRRTSSPDGYNYLCKKCKNAYDRGLYEKKRE